MIHDVNMGRFCGTRKKYFELNWVELSEKGTTLS